MGIGTLLDHFSHLTLLRFSTWVNDEMSRDAQTAKNEDNH
jgi:hypothetical protein